MAGIETLSLGSYPQKVLSRSEQTFPRLSKKAAGVVKAEINEPVATFSLRLGGLIHLEAREQRAFRPLPEFAYGLLKLHCAYNAREILTAIGFLSAEKRTPFQAGVLALKVQKTELLFVTLDKSSALHEGVAYEDYAISPNLFHWQSQNSAAPDTPTGKKYLESPENGWSFQLFVRKNKQSPYRACGPVVLESSHGERPMNIVWRLTNSLPTWLFQELSVLH